MSICQFISQVLKREVEILRCVVTNGSSSSVIICAWERERIQQGHRRGLLWRDSTDVSHHYCLPHAEHLLALCLSQLYHFSCLSRCSTELTHAALFPSGPCPTWPSCIFYLLQGQPQDPCAECHSTLFSVLLSLS